MARIFPKFCYTELRIVANVVRNGDNGNINFFMNPSNSITIIRKFLDAENKRDWQAWSSFLDPSVEYKVVGSEYTVRGKDAYTKHMQRVYTELSDWHFVIVNILDKDGTVMVEFDGRGHFTGEHEGQKYNKAPLRLSAVCTFILKDNKIKEVREFWDPIGFARQLKRDKR